MKKQKKEALSPAAARVMRSISRLKSSKELHRVARLCEKRAGELWQKELAAANEAKWQEAKRWKSGQTVYACYDGVFLDGPGIARNEALTIYTVQPRKRIVWVTLASGKHYGFRPNGLRRWGIVAELPAGALPPSDAQREQAERMSNVGGVLSRVSEKFINEEAKS